MGISEPVLVINAGSSSIKFAVFDQSLDEMARGLVEIETEGSARQGRAGDHHEALALILKGLEQLGLHLWSLGAIAHRVVHGGAQLTVPTRITPRTLAEIRACIPLAPLHNPHNLAAIEALAAQAPDLPQFASFDTGFHATNPRVATTYAVPDDWQKSNIRRFGFHGISYEALVANHPAPLPDRLLAFHLGNGASICAIVNGQSVATTMGYSPLEGLTMGTRSGTIDAGAVLKMAAETSPQEVLDTLNNASGLLALSGISSDMRTLLESQDERAAFAVEHFCYWAARHAGSMIAAMGGVDAIAFTGGIGENAATVRDRITALLGWTGVAPADIRVIPAREERQIAAAARTLMRK